MNCYHARTNPGLEDILARELACLFGAGIAVPADGPDNLNRNSITAHDRTPKSAADSPTIKPLPEGRAGYVSITSPVPLNPAAFSPLRTAYEVAEVSAIHRIPEGTTERARFLAILQKMVRETELPEIPGTATVAVRCRRQGAHPVTSPEVEASAGSVIVPRIGNRVDLKHPDVTVRVDLDDNLLTLGVMVLGPTLDRRYEWIYRPRVTLSTVVAAATVFLSEAPDPRRITAIPGTGATAQGRTSGESAIPPGAILDPFCGSGTIALEASSITGAPVYASDIAPEAVAGTRANVAVNGFADRIAVRRADATVLTATYRDHGIARIICNPPFGVRLGKHIDYGVFYRALLDGAAEILPPGGRLVLLSSRRRGRFNRVLSDSPRWWLRSVHLIEIGGVFPAIFTLERRGGAR